MVIRYQAAHHRLPHPVGVGVPVQKHHVGSRTRRRHARHYPGYLGLVVAREHGATIAPSTWRRTAATDNDPGNARREGLVQHPHGSSRVTITGADDRGSVETIRRVKPIRQPDGQSRWTFSPRRTGRTHTPSRPWERYGPASGLGEFGSESATTITH